MCSRSREGGVAGAGVLEVYVERFVVEMQMRSKNGEGGSIGGADCLDRGHN